MLKSFFEDNSGGLSSMRLVFVIFTLAVVAIWSYVSISKGQMAALDSSIVSVIGILAASKTVQRFGENDETSAPVINNAVTVTPNPIDPTLIQEVKDIIVNEKKPGGLLYPYLLNLLIV